MPTGQPAAERTAAAVRVCLEGPLVKRRQTVAVRVDHILNLGGRPVRVLGVQLVDCSLPVRDRPAVPEPFRHFFEAQVA
eukprot:3847074-Prymnesium_polylepis.1